MKTIKIFNSEIKCSSCSIKQLCLPMLLAESEIEHLEHIIQRKKTLNKGEYLYQAGDKFKMIHAIRSGSVQSYNLTSDGTKQIIGFHLPGEIIGLNALSCTEYPSSVIALETSLICSIPFDKLESLASDIPSLQKQIFYMMSGEIRDDQDLMLLLSKKKAEQRLAAFFMNLSARFSRRGLSDKEFLLTMTRRDIGNYLGLAIETVSRILTRLQDKGLITIRDRHLNISDISGLSELAGTNCHIHH